ncbi:unnamed protein product [Boreogadus saida]
MLLFGWKSTPKLLRDQHACTHHQPRQGTSRHQQGPASNRHKRCKAASVENWADNYDLYIASLNGTKSTHAMVSEFTQHPAPGTIMTGNIGVMQLKIPRLKWSEDSAVFQYPYCPYCALKI